MLGRAFQGAIAATLPLVPKPIVRKIAMRYVAGEELEQARPAMRELHEKGLRLTVALLGEEVTEKQAAEAAVEEYLRVVELLAEAVEPENRFDAGVSIKPTLFGFEIDPTLSRQNMERVVAAAAEHRLPVCIDMEDHPVTDFTLAVCDELQQRYGNVSTVLQAYMRRTLGDIEQSLTEREPSIRLCKGIYIEPKEIAYQSYDRVREKYLEALDALFDRGVFVGIATHDEYLVDEALTRIRVRKLPPDRYEFQTLLGVTEGLRDRLQRQGHPVRVYVPYGADWYAYSVRRLRENPKIAVYVLKALFARS